MANSGRLEVEIGADVSGLEQGISQAERQLRTLESRRDARVRIGADTSELDRRIAGVNTRLNELRTSAQGAQTAVRGMTGQVGNGSNALMQFSRIAQDAPYGIIGIGNNLTATAEAFGHLRNQTGSAGGALRAMASSLMGTGGILLGVSLLTTGFTLLAQSGLSIGDVIAKITGNFDGFGQAIKKASEEGVKSVSGEIFGLKALVSTAQNKTLADKDRLTAVENLQKQYPSYFGNLSKEKIMTSDLTAVVNELTNALVARSIQQKLADGSAEIQLKQFELFAKLNKQKNETSRLELKLEKDLAEAKKVNGISASQLATITAKGINAINASKNAENEYRSEIIKTTDQLERRQNVMNSLSSRSIKLDDKSVKTKVAEVFNTPQVTGITSTIIPAPLFDVNGIAMFNGQVDQFGNKLKSLPGVIETSMDGVKLTMDSGLMSTLELWHNFSEDMNNAISQFAVNSFVGIGQAIGDALANGGSVMDNIGNVLLGTFGSLLSTFGQLMIQAGIGLLLAKKAFQSMNPYLAIAGGLALVAIGSAFSSKTKALGGSSSGGGGSASTSSGATANNNTRTSGGFSGGGGFGGGTVVFEIAGTSLIGVLNNTQARNLRIGGTN
jgi:hypothetical protein